MKKTSRQTPYLSRMLERSEITLAGSTKKTFHIVLEAACLPDDFKVGDSVGILPQNDSKLVEEILILLGAKANEEIVDPKSNLSMSFFEYLSSKANLFKVNRQLLLLVCENGGKSKQLEEALFSDNKELLQELMNQLTVLDCLKMAKIKAHELVKVLPPLLPRFYSIANSPKMYGKEIHLLVAYVAYELNGQHRVGVGSHFLCNLAELGKTEIALYIQPSMHFTVPENLSAPMIMIGPGTGVAPFRAFVQERLATHAKGKNWLFFGERNRKTDFYYESFWTDLEKNGFLRLDLAFSRDSEKKTYVQDKILENKADFWRWIQEGAYIYVCGDAQSMAKSVDLAILKVIEEEGGFSKEEAMQFMKKMRQEKKYLQDVY